MTTDDNQKLRQLLDMTAALISSMDVARRGHTETDRTAWFFVQGLLPHDIWLSSTSCPRTFPRLWS